jgi:phage baseplate assembly protein V
VWERILQTRQSDWELLLDVAERSGLYFLVQDRTLRLMTLEGRGPEVSLTLGENLFEAHLESNSESACSSVSTLGWDPLLAEARGGQANSARLGRDLPLATPLEGNERTLVDEMVQSDDQAAALAQSVLDHLSAGETIFHGVAEGSAELRPGITVSLSGVGDAFTGRYVLTEVEHTIDDRSGFVSRLSTAPVPPRYRPQAAIVTLGDICAVDDPEHLGRVKVTLPAFGELETEWLEVVTAGGGSGKGLLALPDVGDRVLVLCPRGDMAHGFVLGGLYGADGPPDDTATTEGIHRYTFTTPGRQRIRLDDRSKTLTLENAGGSLLEMGPEGVVLRSTVPLTLEAPGSPIRVRGISIDFEKADRGDEQERGDT